MARCDCCGNEYDKAFQLTQNGETHTFDSFQCAIHQMAPVCPSCGCKVIGHGVDQGDKTYCCDHCAKQTT